MRLTRPTSALAAAALAATTLGLVAGQAESAGATRGTHGPVAQRPSSQEHRETPPPKKATVYGRGGAVTSVDADASRIGLRVLRHGGNATDAAIATAAALGVTEPFSSGIGGGGYLVHYDAGTGKVRTIDGRETAPSAMPHDAFIDPKTGEPYNFTPELVTSGVSVGVPGTVATWQRALDRWGTRSLGEALAPARKLARRGFVVDRTFHQQVRDNKVRFEAFRPTKRLYLKGGHAPKVGTRFRNPDLADTYRLLARRGTKAFYRGTLTDEIVRSVRRPPTTRTTDLPVPRGFLRAGDLARYRAVDRRPTHSDFRGYDVYGMGPSSSGGLTVGEALNILEQFPISSMDDGAALHHYLEASALAYADRAAYDGDPRFVDVPTKDLLSDRFARERACRIDPDKAFKKPTKAGDVTSYDGTCGAAAAGPSAATTDTENVETTNLTVADKHGNVVEYTLTIEQTGGSGIVVPGRGFLLNNELTDFSPVYDKADPNRIEPGKRPRSSMSPTILLEDGKPFLALGSPGGSTIITTVLQTIFNRIDRGMSLPDALAAPRAQQSNATQKSVAEPAFIDLYADDLRPYGQRLTPAGDGFGSTSEIGAATAVEFGPGGFLTVAAEPTRRGGGSARVVTPTPAG
ncbi:gamma-glutamyltransferase [Nocardioides sp. KIGAM211]|uniref:Glutathione hydrolase proenzyme n=1 Tax=Nocardioides luti TaxID=2761101 RepID=A0A7X0RH08_9ACTN|nr:gamma-glutamyltransferase [Nocardioides luti]MBB6627185.1 gamma-glutamyltransferase [Nocardioides luti]